MYVGLLSVHYKKRNLAWKFFRCIQYKEFEKKRRKWPARWRPLKVCTLLLNAEFREKFQLAFELLIANWRSTLEQWNCNILHLVNLKCCAGGQNITEESKEDIRQSTLCSYRYVCSSNLHFTHRIDIFYIEIISTISG